VEIPVTEFLIALQAFPVSRGHPVRAEIRDFPERRELPERTDSPEAPGLLVCLARTATLASKEPKEWLDLLGL